jgi:uncharacterized membrane protein YdjX (TVP38/TMEM64 family)
MDSEKRGNERYILKTLLFVILLTVSLAVVRFSPLGYYLNPSHMHLLRDKLSGFHSMAPLIFFSGGALLIAMGVPRSIISILGGMVFGFFAGTFLSLSAALTGSVVIFYFARLFGRPFFRQKFGQRLKAIEGYLEKHGFLVVILIRQLPLPCMLVNVLIGLTSVNTAVYMLGSIIGLLPEAAIFALFGSSVREGFTLRVLMASISMILLVSSLKIYFRRSPMAKELSEKLTKDKA